MSAADATTPRRTVCWLDERQGGALAEVFEYEVLEQAEAAELLCSDRTDSAARAFGEVLPQSRLGCASLVLSILLLCVSTARYTFAAVVQTRLSAIAATVLLITALLLATVEEVAAKGAMRPQNVSETKWQDLETGLAVSNELRDLSAEPYQ